jgi:hypothetical protein
MAILIQNGVLYVAGHQGLTNTDWGEHIEARNLSDGSLIYKRRTPDASSGLSIQDLAGDGSSLFAVGHVSHGDFQTTRKYDPATGYRSGVNPPSWTDPWYGGPGHPWSQTDYHVIWQTYYTYRNKYGSGVSVACGNGKVYGSGHVGGIDWLGAGSGDPYLGVMRRFAPADLNMEQVNWNGNQSTVRWDPANGCLVNGTHRLNPDLDTIWNGPTDLGARFCFESGGRLFRYADGVQELNGGTWDVVWTRVPTNPPGSTSYVHQIAASNQIVITVGPYLGVSIINANTGLELFAGHNSASAADEYTCVCEHGGYVYAAGIQAGKWVVHKLVGGGFGSASKSPSASASRSSSRSVSASASPSTPPASGVTFDNSTDLAGTSGNANASSGNLTWAHEIIGDNAPALFVTVMYGMANGTASSRFGLTVKYNGVAMTLVTKKNGNNNSFTGYIATYVLVNPTTGLHNVTVDWTNSDPHTEDTVQGNACSFNGVDPTTPYQNLATSAGTSAAPWVQVTTSTGNMVLALAGSSAVITGSDQTDAAIENIASGSAGLLCLAAAFQTHSGLSITNWTLSGGAITCCIGFDIVAA